MGPVEMMLVKAVAMGSLVCLVAALYLMPSVFRQMREDVVASRRRLDERDAAFGLPSAPNLPAQPRRVPFRVFYDQEIVDAYDEAVLAGHPPGDTSTFHFVARQTGANLDVVRSMLGGEMFDEAD